MYGGDRDQVTICAVSTPPGRGGLAIVRVSGPKTLEICRPLARFLPFSPESHRAYFGVLRNFSSESEVLDEVLATYFAEGRSYTGEECIEFSCHGNPEITSELLRMLCRAGAVVAGPGEFTYRAFINGKIDLVQAENVLSLIEGRTQMQRRVALRNLRGDLSRRVQTVEDKLLFILAQLEASIDFIEQDIDILEPDKLISNADEALEELIALAQSFESGRMIKEGVEVALIGPPNAGKSSLLNSLLQEDRVIVTDEPGTTRDVVTAELSVGGVLVRISDTAGLRDTESVVESLGILRSRQTAHRADFVFYVFDSAGPVPQDDSEILEQLGKTTQLILAANKADKLTASEKEEFWSRAGSPAGVQVSSRILGSCHDGSLGKFILSHLESAFGAQIDSDVSLVTSSRQFEALNEAKVALSEARKLILESVSPDLIVSETKRALLAVQELAGKEFKDDILDKIFKEFCIGK